MCRQQECGKSKQMHDEQYPRKSLITRLEPPYIPSRPNRVGWWIATLLVHWAHSLTRRDTGDEPIWLKEFAIAHAQAHPRLKVFLEENRNRTRIARVHTGLDLDSKTE